MKKIVFLLGTFSVLLFSCNSKTYEKLDDGVRIHLQNATGKVTLQVNVIRDNIIHVQATPAEALSTVKSLMIADTPKKTVDWKLTENDSAIVLSTSKTSVKISLISGEISFADADGRLCLVEQTGGGKEFTPVVIEGNTYYTIRQVFESPKDEAFYGLGAHQHDLMNYKGKDVDLYQHNIVDIVPFLVSSKNYGILWDNYSRSKFGDPRDYININSLHLFSKDGIEGGLTATYADKDNPDKVFLQKQEDVICYEYLDDLKKIPAEFPLGQGKASWEGSLMSDETGIHKFQVYSAGYMKLWIDGKLLLDTWRQCWNPWSHLLDMEMEAGKKYPLKIEWIPDGGESYIALKYKSPNDPAKQQQLSLWSEVADQIDYYYIAGGNTDEIISGYRTLTGKSPIMPKWAMGFWQSRERYKTQDELLTTVKTFRDRHIPLDNIVLDWFYWPVDKWGDHNFDSARFPDPKGMIDDLHNKYNTQIMISVWPKLYVGTENYKFMNEKGWVFTKNVENQQKDWVGYVSTFYDVYNPEARKYFWGSMNNKLFSMGVDAWWMDATEPDILSNTSLEQRKELMKPIAVGPAAKYFNAYSLYNSRAVYEGQRETNPDKRVFILTRSAYAGQQRYGSATWSGDVACRWYDLKAQISAGLNFAISGIPYWTSDIGGFSLERRYENAQGNDLDEWRELNTRWYQFGVFCPLFRVHGQYPLREIFNIAPEDHPAYKSMLYYAKLRYSLMPYIYTLAGNTFHSDYTIMRALVMDFPADLKVLNIGDQFMFGPSFMVCPVYEYKSRSRLVYLPEGDGWYDFYTGKYTEGGQSLTASAPIERVPLYVKAGSIIPVGPDKEYTMQPDDGELTLWIYTGKDAEFRLYEDEGTNYNYEKGACSWMLFKYVEKERKLVIGARLGTYKGIRESRKINVVVIDPASPKGFNTSAASIKSISYNGEKQIIEL